MRISARRLRGESHNAPFLLSILLSGRAAGEKKAAAYAKLLNRPKGQGEAMKSSRGKTPARNAKKGRHEKSQRPLVDLKMLNCKLRLAFSYSVRILAQEIQRCRFFRCKLRLHGLRLFLRDFGKELNVAVALQTGARGNQPAHDHVFLQAAQVIHLPGNRRFGKHTGGLLEAGRGDERIRGQRRLGDAEEQRTPGRRPPAIADDAIVLFAEAELVHLLLE